MPFVSLKLHNIGWSSSGHLQPPLFHRCFVVTGRLHFHCQTVRLVAENAICVFEITFFIGWSNCGQWKPSLLPRIHDDVMVGVSQEMTFIFDLTQENVYLYSFTHLDIISENTFPHLDEILIIHLGIILESTLLYLHDGSWVYFGFYYVDKKLYLSVSHP